MRIKNKVNEVENKDGKRNRYRCQKSGIKKRRKMRKKEYME